MKVASATRRAKRELKIVDRMAGNTSEPQVQKVMTPAEIIAAREAARHVFVDDKVKRYVVDLVSATRDPASHKLPQLKSLIECGASVRASINLVKVAKANALLAGRSCIQPARRQEHRPRRPAPSLLCRMRRRPRTRRPTTSSR